MLSFMLPGAGGPRAAAVPWWWFRFHFLVCCVTGAVCFWILPPCCYRCRDSVYRRLQVNLVALRGKVRVPVCPTRCRVLQKAHDDILRNKINMAMPVSVLRLPKGPDPNSRGFDPNSPRFIALCRTSIPSSAVPGGNTELLQEEQQARSALRESFLRCLLSISNKKVQFHMHENVKVEATFGASDIDVLNFQVSNLHTPIGVQKEALIRCQDVISFTFDV
ncbi:gem-associated protein 7 isoform X1 [Salarias fasciatus]|uniref:Uncharacterized protein n=2 Tax=Salarias fasciatus TaxID=181472 RepID=A0A672ILT0_SALFA|nr:gem-associated protein 7 isoform X1 [Salarias fasciatus]